MEVKVNVKAIGLMTTGRHVISWPMALIGSAFSANKISLKTKGGVYYGICMQELFEAAIEQGFDIAITVDSDTVPTPNQLRYLVETITTRHDIDALTGFQPKRGVGHHLLSIDVPESARVGDKVKLQVDGPLKVKTAHFGLTAIKLAKLKTVPKPWFASKPGTDGTYNHERIDDDIWFWKQWEKAGLSVFCDPALRLGHLEEIVSIFDENLEHKFMYPEDWRKEFLV